MQHDRDFNSNSTDAMFATILAELKALNEKTDRIEAQTVKTNGRVDKLEVWKTEVTAKTAVIASLVSGAVGVGVSLLTR